MNFSQILIDWYHQNKRDLPWRKTDDPYFIWISEIILQQTRVNQGLAYYEKFVKEFPDVGSLANTPVDRVLKIWQGLGYYSRARNLHASARHIHFERDNKIPDNYRGLLNLKGVGEYTAAAIASFAFNEPVAVVDGNVQRVLSRIFCISFPVNSAEGKRTFKKKAKELLDEDKPGEFNQAIMEFGAMHCIPQNPACKQCPFFKYCCACQKDAVNKFPVKQLRKKRTVRYFHYLRILYDDYTFLQKRTRNDIWNSLYQYPVVESNKELNVKELKETEDWNKYFYWNASDIEIADVSEVYTHNLTHQKIYARFFTINLKSVEVLDDSGLIQVGVDKLSNYAIPKLIDNYHKRNQE